MLAVAIAAASCTASRAYRQGNTAMKDGSAVGRKRPTAERHSGQQKNPERVRDRRSRQAHAMSIDERIARNHHSIA